MDLSHLGLELGGCNEVAALQSDHFTEVPLYYICLPKDYCNSN